MPAGLSLWHRVLGHLCHLWVQPLLTVEPSLGVEKVKLQVGGKQYFCSHVLCHHSAKQEGVGGVILLFGLFLRCGIDSMWQKTEHFHWLPKDIVLHFEILL